VLRIELRTGGEPSAVRLTIFDVYGRIVRQLPDRSGAGGPVVYYWSGEDDFGVVAPPGIYIVLAQLTRPRARSTRQIKRPVAVLW
jgi:hypothetical protein